ncbi:hypothetical protein NDU88_000478 [Pleurodeles waltl]|uniref:Uncharacterized protein n=1 Tax=Pleurodeles waltl TaxID=8319 RepID=A0AAV7V5K1_PLEWA|nr:hypothetical protein NDU88_000478 [Pleurodeles waltl]
MDTARFQCDSSASQAAAGAGCRDGEDARRSTGGQDLIGASRARPILSPRRAGIGVRTDPPATQTLD